MDRDIKTKANGSTTLEAQNLYSKSNDELMDEIEAYMKRSHEKNFDFDPNYIEVRLSIMQERDPIDVEFDPNVEITKLPLNLETAHDTSRKMFRHTKAWRIIKIAAVLSLLLSIATAAGKFSIFDWLKKENAETVSFSTHESGEMNLELGAVAGEQEYSSLQDALNAYEITAKICPTWIPEDYHIVSIDLMVNDEILRFSGAYESNERGRISIQFTKLQGDSIRITSEIEPGGELYEKNGVKYSLFQNVDRNKCHWVNDGFMCVISGNVTLDELKQMLDSIS